MMTKIECEITICFDLTQKVLSNKTIIKSSRTNFYSVLNECKTANTYVCLFVK